MYQDATEFDYNPGSPNRFYNLSFDFAVAQQYKAPSSKRGCYLYARMFDLPIYLNDSNYGPTFKTVGPVQFDASMYRNNVYAEFSLYCDYPGNGTVLIDNVRFTQGGLVVGAG